MSQNSQLYYPTDIALKLTNYCPNNCNKGKYCFAQNSPQGNKWIDKGRIKDIFSQAKDCGLLNLVYFSAEPFADFELLLYVTQAATDAGLKPRFLDTSGYYVGDSLDRSESCFGKLRDAGLDIVVETGYIGTGYVGVDVSVDQFHPITPEQCANTIRGALHVFGPTEGVNMRVTHPAEKYNDNTNKNRTIEALIASGEVKGADEATHRLFFKDGSSLYLCHLRMLDDGFAKKILQEKPDAFHKRRFSMKELRCYKDLREQIPLGDKQIILPFHKLYIDPDGQTYPALSRLPCLSGGNVYDLSVEEVIQNIQANPLLPILIGLGHAGILQLIEIHAGKKASLYAAEPSTITADLLRNTEVVEKIKDILCKTKLHEHMSESLIPALVELRKIWKIKSHATVRQR